jgi:hypothetical protein
MTALPTFATECNATAVAMTLNATNSTSTTSLLIGLGSKSLTVQTAKSYVVGMTVKIASTASPTNWMLGDVTAYTSGTGALVVAITAIQGSGTVAAWTVSQSVPGLQTSGFRNALINGNFGVNQRAVTGTVTLAAGAYGHDRWKAGASGCTYTFATALNITTLTISAGSLIQVIEGINLQSNTYTLSWTGTATGKIGAGVLSASGVSGAAVGGTNLNIEFSTGTLSKVQFEFGEENSAFEFRPYGMELALCQRYYETINALVMHSPYTANSTSSEMVTTWFFKQNKRATGASIQSATAISPGSIGLESCTIQLTTNPIANVVTNVAATASSEL